MDIFKFQEKWDDKTLAQCLAVILERGLRATIEDGSGKDPEDKGSLLSSSELIAKDLLQLSWQQIKYIIKRKL